MQVQVSHADNIQKKWKVYIPSQGCTVEFGQWGASDYTIHRDTARMRDYLKRHGGQTNGVVVSDDALVKISKSNKEKWGKKDGICTAGFWSRWLLWSFPQKKDVIKMMKYRMNIDVKWTSEVDYRFHGKMDEEVPWNDAFLEKSPFYKVAKTLPKARQLARETLKKYVEGQTIGFSFESSLKSMGKIRRQHGRFQLGDKYLLLI